MKKRRHKRKVIDPRERGPSAKRATIQKDGEVVLWRSCDEGTEIFFVTENAGVFKNWRFQTLGEAETKFHEVVLPHARRSG